MFNSSVVIWIVPHIFFFLLFYFTVILKCFCALSITCYGQKLKSELTAQRQRKTINSRRVIGLWFHIWNWYTQVKLFLRLWNFICSVFLPFVLNWSIKWIVLILALMINYLFRSCSRYKRGVRTRRKLNESL